MFHYWMVIPSNGSTFFSEALREALDHPRGSAKTSRAFGSGDLVSSPADQAPCRIQPLVMSVIQPPRTKFQPSNFDIVDDGWLEGLGDFNIRVWLIFLVDSSNPRQV